MFCPHNLPQERLAERIDALSGDPKLRYVDLHREQVHDIKARRYRPGQSFSQVPPTVASYTLLRVAPHFVECTIRCRRARAVQCNLTDAVFGILGLPFTMEAEQGLNHPISGRGAVYWIRHIPTGIKSHPLSFGDHFLLPPFPELAQACSKSEATGPETDEAMAYMMAVDSRMQQGMRLAEYQPPKRLPAWAAYRVETQSELEDYRPLPRHFTSTRPDDVPVIIKELEGAI